MRSSTPFTHSWHSLWLLVTDLPWQNISKCIKDGIRETHRVFLRTKGIQDGSILRLCLDWEDLPRGTEVIASDKPPQDLAKAGHLLVTYLGKPYVLPLPAVRPVHPLVLLARASDG